MQIDSVVSVIYHTDVMMKKISREILSFLVVWMGWRNSAKPLHGHKSNVLAPT
jgi:hypothetical protein